MNTYSVKFQTAKSKPEEFHPRKSTATVNICDLYPNISSFFPDKNNRRTNLQNKEGLSLIEVLPSIIYSNTAEVSKYSLFRYLRTNCTQRSINIQLQVLHYIHVCTCMSRIIWILCVHVHVHVHVYVLVHVHVQYMHLYMCHSTKSGHNL